jgi:hypothetical protein
MESFGIVPTTILDAHPISAIASVVRRTDTGAEAVIQGTLLEAQYRCGEFFLVFMTMDTLEEETLTIHLLNADLKRCHRKWMRGIYSPGIVDNFQVVGSGVSFTFPSPQYQWFLKLRPSVWHYLFGKRCSMRICLAERRGKPIE